MSRHTLIDSFDDFSRAKGFLVYDDGFRARSHSYAEVGRAGRGFTARLADAGLRKGDEVVFWSENRPHDISLEQHIRIHAACQAHVDNAVSNTVNLAADATVAQVEHAFRYAFERGCNGITVYGHGARPWQVLAPIAWSGLCPDCRTALEFSEGATLCRGCGFSTAV